MERFYHNFLKFGKALYHFKNEEDLHYKLSNILSLICYQTIGYYCFCDRYLSCKKEFRGMDLCPLCQISIEFRNFEEDLDRNHFNLNCLKGFAFRLFPFLEECYHVDKQ